MQRIDADKIKAAPARKSHQRRQIAKIAHAPVGSRSQAVELHRHAVEAVAGGQIRRLISAIGRRNQEAAEHTAILLLHTYFIIALGQSRQRKREAV